MSWLRLLLRRDSQDGSVAVGDMKLHAANRAEALFLFAEIFLSNTYGPQLNMDKPVIIDCGANCGFATALFTLLYPTSKIIAIEPAPSALRILRENARLNSWDNVEIVEAACGREGKTIQLIESSHMSLISSVLPERGGGRVVEVPVLKVSSLVGDRVNLLKLDVEGAEHEVLLDLVETGAIARVERLAIEYHHRLGGARPRLAAFLGLLEQSGFTYSLCAGEVPGARYGDAFQDMMIYAHRKP